MCLSPAHKGRGFMAAERKPEGRDPKAIKSKISSKKKKKQHIMHTIFMGFHLSLINTTEAELSQKSSLHGNGEEVLCVA